ncbi:spirocyclase AveC family protein [Lentzea sp. NPDC051838]|uniref:spirocyclase AveC family protein n=1 Tax=Lentzea sp. NPDC051838 TaxID=3154849 RepID=UPI00342BED6F
MVQVTNRVLAPIKVWAVIGTAFLVFQAWVFGRWLLAGGARPVPGTEGTSVLAVVMQAFFAACFVVVSVVLVRRALAQRLVTLDLAVYVGFLACVWQDALFNFHGFFVSYNRDVLNVTSWGPFIPGWHGDHPGLQVETVLAPGGLAIPLLIIWVWVQTWLTDRLTRPHWPAVRLWSVSVLAGVAMNIVLEYVLIATHMYAYTAPTPYLTLFEGHWYQISLAHNLLIVLFVSTPSVMVHYYARRTGSTPVIFQGMPEPSTGLRLLAGVGFINLGMLALMAGTAVLSYLGGPVPSDLPADLRP